MLQWTREFRRLMKLFRDNATQAREALRDNQQIERELHDGLLARVTAYEHKLDTDASLLMAEWRAIDAGFAAPEQKRLAQSVLFGNMAIQYSRLVRQGTKATNKPSTTISSAAPILVEISLGELIDRLTILEIKLARFSDAARLSALRHEYDALLTSLIKTVLPSEQLNALRAELKLVNESLWRSKDEMREHEHQQDFGGSFVALAHSAYLNNDRRVALKRQISELMPNGIVEEKGYAPC